MLAWTACQNVVAQNGGSNAERERTYLNRVFDTPWDDEHLYIVPSDSLAMDFAITEKLEYLISKQPCKFLNNDLYSMQKMRYVADYKFDIARKILKFIHRPFRFEDEDQYQLTHLNYLQQLDYMNTMTITWRCSGTNLRRT